MSDFFYGFTALFEGFSLIITNERVRKWSMIPLLVALLIGSILTVLGLYYLAGIIPSIVFYVGSRITAVPGSWIVIILTIVVWPIMLLILGLVTYIAIRLFVSPVYSFLAEAVLAALDLKRAGTLGVAGWLSFSLRMFLITVVRSVIFLAAAVLFFICSFVPFLNILAWLGVSLALAFDFSDYSFEAMGWSLSRRFTYVKKNFNLYAGFAVCLGFLFTIPGMGIVIMPAAVVTGGLLMKRAERVNQGASIRG